MKIQRNDTLLRLIVLLSFFVASCGNAWAVSSSCAYYTSGTGMGGTGIVANKGTGMGGTGVTPQAEKDEMQIAGNVIFSQGVVEAQSNGRARLLAKGSAVCVGETIVTSESGAVQIRMADDGLVAVRPQTQLKIEKFAYAGTGKDISLFLLLRGASRFVTGKLGQLHPENDLIKTPDATIGVRGTDHEAMVILPGDRIGYLSGTYDKVNQGITFIKTGKGEIDIHPNQVGLAANTEEMPTLLRDIPDFYNTNPSLQEDGGLFKDDKKEEGSGDNKNEAHPQEPTGKGIEQVNPDETGAHASEHPENQINLDIHESPSFPELPESPSTPELPESPSSESQ